MRFSGLVAVSLLMPVGSVSAALEASEPRMCQGQPATVVAAVGQIIQATEGPDVIVVEGRSAHETRLVVTT
jgi:hypothetical protein